MNYRAATIGDLALGVLARETSGEITRLFERSAYVKVGGEFVLLLWGKLRSSITINIEGAGGPAMGVGERCTLAPGGLAFESCSFEVREAEVYRSALLQRRHTRLPSASSLASGISFLRGLYDASPSGPSLVADPELRRFVKTALTPLAAGDDVSIHAFNSYLGLIGRGGGFTPAGDDFVGGLVSTYNYLARCRDWKEISFHVRRLRPRTVPESAALVAYAAKGYVDEGVGSLILRTLGGSARFTDELLAVTRRGHTSGLDMSLGILLVEAALSDSEREGGALDGCLRALWHQ